MRIRNSLVPALAAVLLFAAGSTLEAQTLRVGAAANVGGLIVFVAQDKGIFAKHGIDAKVVTRNTGAQLTKSLRAGEIDFAPDGGGQADAAGHGAEFAHGSAVAASEAAGE